MEGRFELLDALLEELFALLLHWRVGPPLCDALRLEALLLEALADELLDRLLELLELL